MSLILDALRKMEKERKRRRASAPGLTPQVLNYQGSPRIRERNPLWAWGGGIAVVAIAASIFFFLNRGGEQPAEASLKSEKFASAKETPSAAPELPAVPLASPPLPPPQPQPLPVEKPSVAPQKPVKVKTLVTTAPADTGLTISGIAWQEERSLRRAVVNNALVGEGAEIGGARVVEIREYRVRFSRGGQTFDIPFNAGVRSK
jgi:general secretion pathway protein B